MDPDRETALAAEATNHMTLSHWTEALPLYSRLYAETHRAGYLWNAAVCQVELTKQGAVGPEAAIHLLRQYVAAPDASADQKKRAEAIIATMEELRQKKTEKQTDDVKRPPVAPPPNPVAGAPTAPSPASREEPKSTITAQGDSSRAGRGLKIAALGTGAGGLVALIAGGYFSYRVTSINDDLTTAKQFSASDDASGETAHTMQFVMYGVGAAALATAGVLYYMGSQRSEGTSVALLPWINPAGGGGAIQARF
jgi:hypothetical protein